VLTAEFILFLLTSIVIMITMDNNEVDYSLFQREMNGREVCSTDSVGSRQSTHNTTVIRNYVKKLYTEFLTSK
jgi:hypothetical protein